MSDESTRNIYIIIKQKVQLEAKVTLCKDIVVGFKLKISLTQSKCDATIVAYNLTQLNCQGKQPQIWTIKGKWILLSCNKNHGKQEGIILYIPVHPKFHQNLVPFQENVLWCLL